jgi:hypothetical protein
MSEKGRILTVWGYNFYKAKVSDFSGGYSFRQKSNFMHDCTIAFIMGFQTDVRE